MSVILNVPTASEVLHYERKKKRRRNFDADLIRLIKIFDCIFLPQLIYPIGIFEPIDSWLFLLQLISFMAGKGIYFDSSTHARVFVYVCGICYV